MEINTITGRILEAAVAVHRRLGPGLLESAYQEGLCVEMERLSLRYERERVLPMVYDGRRLNRVYRLDFLVEGRVVVEVKAVRTVHSVFMAQLLSYLRLGGYPVGLLINFNVPYLGNGAVRRVVNGYAGPLPRDSLVGPDDKGERRSS